MRTLFLNPPSYDDFDGGAGSRYQATREVWSFWYPTWLCYPAGMIPDSKVVDAPPEGLSQDTVTRMASDYDLVLLHTSTPSFSLDCRTARMMKDVNPKCVIGFAGGHVTAEPEAALRAGEAIDFVTRKEMDLAVKEVWEQRDWSDVLGISYRKNDSIHHNPDRPVLGNEDLDALPFVTPIYHRDLDYLKYNSPYCQYPYVSLYTGRGCPARCTFCLWPQVTTGHSYRVRSPENVLEEVRGMPKLFPEMKEIFFDDDTFTADPARARKIGELMRPTGLCWSTNSRANVDRDTLKILKDGGLRLFVIGYESGSDAILKNIKKGVSTARARRFTRDCHDIGILIHGTFIVGLPGETMETIEESIRFAREMNPETLQVSLASPYPGTEFFRYVEDEGFLVNSVYNDESGYQRCTVTYPNLSSEEIFDSVERFYRQYYFRPSYIFKSVKKMVKSRDERKRLLREAGEFFTTMKKRRAAKAAA